MAEEKKSWKDFFDYRFIYGEELTKDTVVTIERFKVEKVFSQKSQKNEDALTIYFVGAKKGLVVNKLNSKVISKVVGSVYPEDWVGKKIILKGVKGRFFGEEQTVVRVKEQKVRD